jgi:FKBP-type peptidyl-prolyl cis-trans isomerase FklB
MKLILTVCLIALSLAACNKAPAASAPASAAATLAAGNAFLEANAKKEGVKTTPSGLQYKIITSGPADGVPPKATDEVKVNYQGTLIDGHEFDSSYQAGIPATFRVNEVVPGWTEALQLMRPGDVWMVYLPAKLGYGEESKGPDLPSNSALIFKVELLDVLRL